MKRYINKIHHRDCLELMQEMPKGQIDLIYIDPPFCCEADKKFGMIAWSKNTQPKNRVDEILPLIEEIQGVGIANYLRWMYPRLYLMKELLSEQGSIYVHLDWHVGHYVKIMMDDIFGKNNILNEIIWCYKSGGVGDKTYSKKHDTLLFYKKSSDVIFNVQKEKSYMGLDYSTGNKNVKLFNDNDGLGPYTLVNVKDWWNTIGMLATSSKERVGYATQKPEALLERIIKASSNENSIVADFFAGSGTTLAVAEKLGRKWIGCDMNEQAVEISRKRLKQISITGANQ